MSILDTSKMIKELAAAGVEFVIEDSWTGEETYNHIIHQYNITFCPVSGHYNPEVADILYSVRGFRNQKWTKAFKPGRY